LEQASQVDLHDACYLGILILGAVVAMKDAENGQETKLYVYVLTPCRWIDEL
jgi:hypothetical protein